MARTNFYRPPAPGDEPAKPDWVILGTPWADGLVAVFASRDLTQAELETRMDRYDRYDSWLDPFDRMSLGRQKITLTVEMNDFIMVVADSYQRAFADPLKTWTPDRAPRRELDHRRALPPRPPSVIEMGSF